jgi:hypothetical protein
VEGTLDTELIRWGRWGGQSPPGQCPIAEQSLGDSPIWLATVDSLCLCRAVTM